MGDTNLVNHKKSFIDEGYGSFPIDENESQGINVSSSTDLGIL